MSINDDVVKAIEKFEQDHQGQYDESAHEFIVNLEHDTEKGYISSTGCDYIAGAIFTAKALAKGGITIKSVDVVINKSGEKEQLFETYPLKDKA